MAQHNTTDTVDVHASNELQQFTLVKKKKKTRDIYEKICTYTIQYCSQSQNSLNFFINSNIFND